VTHPASSAWPFVSNPAAGVSPYSYNLVPCSNDVPSTVYCYSLSVKAFLLDLKSSRLSNGDIMEKPRRNNPQSRSIAMDQKQTIMHSDFMSHKQSDVCDNNGFPVPAFCPEQTKQGYKRSSTLYYPSTFIFIFIFTFTSIFTFPILS